MRLGRSLTLAAIALAFLAGPARAQTTLRYQFKDGEKLQYAMTQDIKMSMNVAGMDIEMKMKQGLDMNWDIQKVDDKGNAKVRLTIGRVKLSIQSPMANAEVDTGAKKAADPDDPIAKAFSDIATGLAALEMTFTMGPDGEMKDVKIPEEALKKLRSIPGAEQFGGQLLSPDGLKKMTGAGMMLPKEAVTKGKQWTQKMTMKMPNIGEMSGDMKYTYEGPVDKDGKKLEKIQIIPTLKIKPDADAPVQIKMKAMKDKGYALFDNQAGRLVETTNEGTMEMEIEAGGMTIQMQMQQNTLLRLMNRARPRPR
jgi:hypothetical protein